MKRLFPLLLLVIMTTSVVVPVMVQWQGDVIAQMIEDGQDDGKDDIKVEKEKEVYTFNSPHFILPDVVSDDTSTGSLYFKHDELISECHVFMPKTPPEA